MTSSADRNAFLYIDIETYSGTDITESGSYHYMEDPDFGILLIAFTLGDDPVKLIDLCPQTEEEARLLPEKLNLFRNALQDPSYIKVAHNCSFERNAFLHYYEEYQPPEQWLDTMALCAYNGLPLSLDAAGEALHLPLLKMKEGKALISYFCKPCTPTKANGGRTRNRPDHAPEKWETFKSYCKRDVETMREIHKRIGSYRTTDFERTVFKTDCEINERGVMVDTDFVRAAMDIDARFREKGMAELAALTGLENPNSVSQLKEFLLDAGLATESLSKAAVADLKDQAQDETTKRVLELRQLLSKTSTKKYEAMINAAGEGDRIRGIMQYYGTRTGRWAGRLVQLQNLPQNHLDHIEEVREIVKSRDLESLEMLFDSVPDVLSQLIRTALVAKEGHTFLVADYSAIEARVTAYLSGEQWRMKVFADGGDIYCASASQMFKVPVVKHGVNGHLRQKGKIAELALGYGGGPAALKAFGADKMGLSEEEMQEIVQKWRASSPNICRMWQSVEKAAKAALTTPGRTVKVRQRVYDPERARENEEKMDADPGTFSDYFLGDRMICAFKADKDALRITLPSGRILTYWGAMLDDGVITYMGQNQTTRKWEKISTWGGKLVENIVQAYARDCLAVAMVRLETAGWHIVFHVHDEVIVEAPEGSRWQDVADIMGQPIDWAPGLLLRGDGYTTRFYMKD